jgi:hypothetical protein
MAADNSGPRASMASQCDRMGVRRRQPVESRRRFSAERGCPFPHAAGIAGPSTAHKSLSLSQKTPVAGRIAAKRRQLAVGGV